MGWLQSQLAGGAGSVGQSPRAGHEGLSRPIGRGCGRSDCARATHSLRRGSGTGNSSTTSNTIAPGVEREPGSRGVPALANRDLGVVMFESLWATDEAMRESGKHLGRFFGATTSSEEYEVRNLVLLALPRPGAGAPLVRLSGDSAGFAAYHDCAPSPACSG